MSKINLLCLGFGQVAKSFVKKLKLEIFMNSNYEESFILKINTVYQTRVMLKGKNFYFRYN